MIIKNSDYSFLNSPRILKIKYTFSDFASLSLSTIQLSLWLFFAQRYGHGVPAAFTTGGRSDADWAEKNRIKVISSQSES